MHKREPTFFFSRHFVGFSCFSLNSLGKYDIYLHKERITKTYNFREHIVIALCFSADLCAFFFLHFSCSQIFRNFPPKLIGNFFFLLPFMKNIFSTFKHFFFRSSYSWILILLCKWSSLARYAHLMALDVVVQRFTDIHERPSTMNRNYLSWWSYKTGEERNFHRYTFIPNTTNERE